jgi:hypothetical protein
MKSLGIRCIIEKDLHELYEIHPDDDWSQFGWRLSYGNYEEDFRIDPTDHPENWYWVPIPWKKMYAKPR